MNNQYQLLIRMAGTSGPIRRQTYAGEERLRVRDLSTRVTIQVRASEVSPYCHTLLLDDAEYQIMNVTGS